VSLVKSVYHLSITISGNAFYIIQLKQIPTLVIGKYLFAFRLPILVIGMYKTSIRVGTAGRGQIPIDVRRRMGIREGDIVIVEIQEILKQEVPR